MITHFRAALLSFFENRFYIIYLLLNYSESYFKILIELHDDYILLWNKYFCGDSGKQLSEFV